MKKVVVSLSLLVALSATSSAFAQKPGQPQSAHSGTAKLEDTRVEVSPGELAPTTEMWFYEQEIKRHDDPKQAVRRNAEFAQAQRQSRIASRQWYGFSNQRPQADPMPFLGDYSPCWRSNTCFPYQWAATTGGTMVVIRPEIDVRY